MFSCLLEQTHEPGGAEADDLLAESEHGRRGVRRAGLRRVQSAAWSSVTPRPKYPSAVVSLFQCL